MFYKIWSRTQSLTNYFIYISTFHKKKHCYRLNAPKTPPSVEVLDSNNKAHTLHVEVLGAEETWHSPSLLLVTVETSKGKVIFSQVCIMLNIIPFFVCVWLVFYVWLQIHVKYFLQICSGWLFKSRKGLDLSYIMFYIIDLAENSWK